MASAYLPLVEPTGDDEVLTAVSRLGAVLLPSSGLESLNPLPPSYIVFDDNTTTPNTTPEEATKWLDNGAERIAVPLVLAKQLIGVLPADRLLLLLDAGSVSAVSERLRNGVSGVLLKLASVDVDFVSSFRRFFPSQFSIFVLPTSITTPTPLTIRQLVKASATLVIPTTQLTLSPTTSTTINVADAFLAPLVSDRPDGLFPTIVSSYLQGGKSLGLVYSSAESIKESIITGRGVYQSRKHGLWRKGETSGATQEIVQIRADCDSDSLEFQVIQSGVGFCHLGTTSCFGGLRGLSLLESTLQSRLESAPEGSYTKRLFTDQELLRSKIMEEADELCNAITQDEIAFEAADLFYFALTRCVANGVSIADVEEALDKKSKKVTRRPGNAKSQWSSTAESSLASISQSGSADAPTKPLPVVPSPPTSSPNDPIQMRKADLSHINAAERAGLLQRPVLRSDEMIAKVKPIIDLVRQNGDNALKELTAKFDKAQLDEVIIRPPFSEEAMRLDPKVKQAINAAYKNIHTFHLAQAEKEPLVVETMPGVVCTRFARPIARVGLYVPGGTAVLPSTALMLGVPAQVAGCKEIVLAVPPRPDGSVVPEVLYAAHLVGASIVLKVGGAQAIAAMAYGTETVPKVDKIFGPGNQWVTAAKMSVQNDTDALVAIDMPAGPSEVLVCRLLMQIAINSTQPLKQ